MANGVAVAADRCADLGQCVRSLRDSAEDVVIEGAGGDTRVLAQEVVDLCAGEHADVDRQEVVHHPSVEVVGCRRGGGHQRAVAGDATDACVNAKSGRRVLDAIYRDQRNWRVSPVTFIPVRGGVMRGSR
jgi:hypothetical protein